MTKFKLLAATAAATMALGAASAASAASLLFDLSYYNGSTFTGTLGTITLTDHCVASVCTDTLDVDVHLNLGSWFQMAGKTSAPDDDLYFDITGSPGVTYAISSPSTGAFPVDGQFTGVGPTNNAYGQGFLQNYDYAIQGSDSSKPINFYGNGNNLTFSIKASSGTLDVNSIPGRLVDASNSQPSATVYFGADIRQCTPLLNSDPNQNCSTGPVGAILDSNNHDFSVPEPASWALMLMGFGGLGAVLRRRRSARAIAA